MKKFRLTSSAVMVVILTLALASTAQAQATRTWVSGVGDDANPCSRTAPCKTFAGAISKTAPGGEIDALDDGGFGAVTITKPITINGGGHIASILASGTNAVNVSAGGGDTVTLLNLYIFGSGTGLVGVKINTAKAVHIENCQIYGFRDGANGRAISDVRTSTSTSPQLFVNDTFIRDNLTGIGVTGSAGTIRAFIRNCRVENNGGFGILGSNSAFVTVENTIIALNAGDGFKIDSSAAGAVLGCTVMANVSGVLNSGGTGVFLANDSIFNNSTGVSGAVVTFGNNNVRNNGGGNTLPATVGQQ